MLASEWLVEVLIAIEIEAAAFYEALARRPGERPELRALWALARAAGKRLVELRRLDLDGDQYLHQPLGCAHSRAPASRRLLASGNRGARLSRHLPLGIRSAPATSVGRPF